MQYFAFCLTPGPNYLVQYAAATYLSPQHKFVLSDSEVQLVKEYLSSKDKNWLILSSEQIFVLDSVKLTARAAAGPSSAPDNNNVSYIMPGLSSLSGLLTQSFAQTATSAQGLSENLEKDLQLYMNKASLHNLRLSNQATVNKDGVKEITTECPLRFWFGQVNFTQFQTTLYSYNSG